MRTMRDRLRRLVELVKAAGRGLRRWWTLRRVGESGPPPSSDDDMEPLTGTQLRSAFASYLERYEAVTGLLPDPVPLPFDPVPSIHTAVWSVLGDAMVAGELSELTNLLNQWMGALRRWNAWNEVLAGLPEEVRWGVEWELVEPIAFMCMFQPSAARDRFTFVATNALHQIRLARDPATKDELLGDAKPPKYLKHYPSRAKKEEQLRKLAAAWPTGAEFIEAHELLDDDGYEAVSSDFRNRASHAIAPRFSIGITSIVVRERVQQTAMEEQPDGTYDEVAVPGKMATSYSYGGTSPLGMQQAWETNLAQFEFAKRCFFAYIALLREATAAMPQRPAKEGETDGHGNRLPSAADL